MALAICVQCAASAAFGADSAGSNGSQPQGAAQTADATQNFVSPLGAGNGGTLSVTDKSAVISATIDQSFDRSGFWQVGVSGAADKNNTALVYDSSDTDAPGFKAKIGGGYSSFQSVVTTDYTRDSAKFLREAWCMDIVKSINHTLSSPLAVSNSDACGAVIASLQQAISEKSLSSNVDAKTLPAIARILSDLTTAPYLSDDLCGEIKQHAKDAYDYCPGSGKPIKTAYDQSTVYAAAYASLMQAPLPTFYYKVSLNYTPTLVSTDYRAVVGGVPDLADSHHWQRFLSAGALDLSFYDAAWSGGLELGYGDTVTITQSNVCNTTTSGSYSSQTCKMAMIGEPAPVETFSATMTIQNSTLLSPLTSGGFRPGFQLVAHYERPTDGSSHLAYVSVPIYAASPSSPLKLVFGIEPMWMWNTNPKVGNSFNVTLFVGARPGLAN
jgi:hypothetical protein